MGVRLALVRVALAVGAASALTPQPLTKNATPTVRTAPARVIVHVGPRKTGSSAIQRALLEPPLKLRRLLAREDAFVIPRIPGRWTGFMSHGNIAQALSHNDGAGPVQEDSRELVALDKAVGQTAAAPGARLLLSSEGFSMPKCNATWLLGALAPRLRSVRVVVAYRRLFEWVPSLHNQIFKDKAILPRTLGKAVERFGGLPPYATLVDFLGKSPGSRAHWREHGWSGSVYDRYRALGADVTLLNIHAAEPPLRQLMCAHMSAQRSCEWLQESSTGRALVTARLHSARPREHMSVLDVLTAATKRGIIRKTIASTTLLGGAARWLEDRLARGELPPLPLRCASQRQLAELLRFSIAEEARLLPAWHSADALRARFEKAVNASTFCSADVDAALTDGGPWHTALRDRTAFVGTSLQAAETYLADVTTLELGSDVDQSALQEPLSALKAALFGG